MTPAFKSKRRSGGPRAWTTVGIPPESLAALSAFCEARGITRVSAVQVAIAEMIEKHDTKPVTP